MQDYLRKCIFRPYAKGMGPSFVLTLHDMSWQDEDNYRVSYSLKADGKVIFKGDDFFPGPFSAVDSNASVAALMDFLTLRPGDTDKEYFENYTPDQRAFCAQHAEALGLEVMQRFGILE